MKAIFMTVAVTMISMLMISGDCATIATPCSMCHLMMNSVQKQGSAWPILPMLERVAVEYCVRKHIQDRTVCNGAIKEMANYIVTGMWRHLTNPHIVCQDLFLCPKEYVKRDLQTDIAAMIRDKPNRTWENPTGRRTLKVVHISDLHPDLYYAEGSPVDCTEPVCCRANVPAKTNSTRKAGYWGSIGVCDLPLQTFDVFLNQIKKIKPDVIIWTGDNTPHDIWQQSQSYNLNFTILLSQKIRSATNTTVIPAMGNHQSYPVNVYDYKDKNREAVLHAGLAQAWKYWLDERAIKMQKQKGHYSMTYPHLNNLKVISINTQAGNDQNWLLLQDVSDPGDVLKWIQEQLKQSEKNNQMVYLIGHIPPKNNLNDWAMRFNAIIDRYSYIVRAQFYGHTHNDHFSFIPKMNNIKNISSAQLSNFYMVAPSLTTQSDRMPQFRIVNVDYDTLLVTDYQQYRLDLRKYQRKQQKPQFQLYYKFKDSFKIKDMSIQGGITELRNKLRDSAQWQKIYEQHKCGGICEGSSGKNVFCDAMSSPQFQIECLGKTYKKSAFQKAAGPWRQYKHRD